MTIHKPESDRRAEWLHVTDNDRSVSLSDYLDGTPRARNWEPAAVELLRKGDRNLKLVPVDAPVFSSGSFIVKDRARRAIGHMLEDFGEFLPLKSPEGTIWAYNATHVLDALDMQKCEFTRFPSGLVVDINRYVFKPEVVRGIHAFRIANFRPWKIFFSGEFVARWQAAKLTGITFREVWSDA